jgi:hypothetical protein
MPSLKRLAFAAYVLDVPLGDLISGASHLAGDAATELHDILKEVSPGQRKVLLDMTRAVAAEFVNSNQAKS